MAVQLVFDAKVKEVIGSQILDGFHRVAVQILPKATVYVHATDGTSFIVYERLDDGWFASVFINLRRNPLHDLAHELGHIAYRERRGPDPVMVRKQGLKVADWRSEVAAWMWAERVLSELGIQFDTKYAMWRLTSYVLTGAFDPVSLRSVFSLRVRRDPELHWFYAHGGRKQLIAQRIGKAVGRLLFKAITAGRLF